MRTLMVWCPDWPVIAAEIVDGVPASGPVAVLHGNRVLACSEAARADGVRRGLRRREAQSRCPQLVVVDHDPGRDARAFEPVVTAVEEVAVGVEVIRPGACALAARGPARYFGSEEKAAERIVEQVAQECGVESQVGIADGVFAAGLAARAGRIVASGRTGTFLSEVPVEALERPDLTDLLRRLGIATLGDFAALPASDVLTRFGFDGALAHRLAAGQDHRPLAVRQPPPDLDVSDTYDEPLERVDVAAFAGRVLAERLHDRLAAHGLACTRLGIEAVTADGQELHRVWRHDGTLTAAAIAERVRWQLDGWLTGARRGAPARPTAGLVRLRLVPDGVLVHLGLQPGLWGDAGAERERAHRALSRVQGLLGPDAVVTPVIDGGRSADDQARLVPWGDERVPERAAGAHADPIPGVTNAPVVAEDAEPAGPNLVLLSSPGEQAGEPADPEQTGDEPAVWAALTGGAAEDEERPQDKKRKEKPFRVLAGMGAAAEPGTGMGRPGGTEGSAEVGKVGVDGAVSTGEVAPIQKVKAEGIREEKAEVAREGEPGAAAVEEEAGAGKAEAGKGEESGSAAAPGKLAVAYSRREATPKTDARKGPRTRKPPPALPPWPGRLPKPAPAVVLHQPIGAVVLDQDDQPVRVSARLELTGEPTRLLIENGGPIDITGWAGPWPVDERWWAPAEARRRARFQISVADGRAFLLVLAGGLWAVEAIYD
jgi:protein ImuB